MSNLRKNQDEFLISIQKGLVSLAVERQIFDLHGLGFDPQTWPIIFFYVKYIYGYRKSIFFSLLPIVKKLPQ